MNSKQPPKKQSIICDNCELKINTDPHDCVAALKAQIRKMKLLPTMLN